MERTAELRTRAQAPALIPLPSLPDPPHPERARVCAGKERHSGESLYGTRKAPAHQRRWSGGGALRESKDLYTGDAGLEG